MNAERQTSDKSVNRGGGVETGLRRSPVPDVQANMYALLQGAYARTEWQDKTFPEARDDAPETSNHIRGS